MATAAEPLLMSVEQYRSLPSRADSIQELRWGQVVTLTFPKKQHTKIQSRLQDLLRPAAEGKGLLAIEFPFRAVPEYDLRAADVAFVSSERWEQTPDNDNLHGAPELVIEVLSPSNTPAEMREKAALCLSNRSEEFWIVDLQKRTVTVMRKGESTQVYHADDQISLRLLDTRFTIADIFA